MTQTDDKLTFNALMADMVANAYTMRSELFSNLFDSRRDIDEECGYPKTITPEAYRRLFEREGVARRCVTVLPEESWAEDPNVFETEDPDQTPFEEALAKVLDERNVYHYLERVDVVSGIGRFGVLLLGLDDGLPMDQPVEGINEDGSTDGKQRERKLLYLRAFDETVVEIKTREDDETNPRFGQPTMYSLIFKEMGSSGQGDVTKLVHWSRVIHVADNRFTSEVFGTPRLEAVYNRIYDIRKVLSGSGEMFWKGAFPGFAFEINPELGDAELDTDSLRTEFANYANGLQRYLAITGVTAKSLSPQVADPSKHMDAFLMVVAITMAIPKRILFGSEAAQLASSQDARTWNKRLRRRQEKYLTPLVLRPFVQRLIDCGVVPAPSEEDGFTCEWPDLNTTTDKERADVLDKIVQALAKYLAGGVDELVPPSEFFSMFMELEPEQVDQLISAAEDYAEVKEEEEPEVSPVDPNAPPGVPPEDASGGQDEPNAENPTGNPGTVPPPPAGA